MYLSLRAFPIHKKLSRWCWKLHLIDIRFPVKRKLLHFLKSFYLSIRRVTFIKDSTSTVEYGFLKLLLRYTDY